MLENNKSELASASTQLYLRKCFSHFLSPLPPGGPGEGPDYHFVKEIYHFGPSLAESGGKLNFNVYFDLKHGWV